MCLQAENKSLFSTLSSSSSDIVDVPLPYSLDLKAAILGTFTTDLEWMAQTFPQLVGPNSTVPTLLLHGHKGLTNRLKQKAEAAEEDLLPESEEQENSQPNTNNTTVVDGWNKEESEGLDFRLPCFSPTKADNADASSMDGSLSLQTQEDHTSPLPMPMPSSSSWTTPQTRCKRPQELKPAIVTDSTKTTRSRQTNLTTCRTTPKTIQGGLHSSSLGDHFHLTQVLSAWRPSKADSTVTHEETKEATASRETKRGVHHPKFMVLFETSGDLVVVVSTANLTPNKTVEGSWMQRFRAKRWPILASATTTTKPTSATTTSAKQQQGGAKKKNDFGPVLQDFLDQLSESAVEDQPKVDDFLTKYLPFGLEDLSLRYQFDKAQVHLVPVIPGDWKDKVRKSQRFLYGRQRVQSLLQEQEPHLLQSKKDRLVLQPTSFGGNWQRSQVADVVRSYLHYNNNNKNKKKEQKQQPADFWDDAALLEKVDLVWPSHSFIQASQPPPPLTTSTSTNTSTNTSTKASKQLARRPADSSFVFLSSQVFNSCDVSCLSRMARYQPSHPPQRPTNLVPHFKSVTRVVANREYVQQKKGGVPPADDYLSWFLLTSACFSHGAQGKREDATKSTSATTTTTKASTVAYANFELGVLFTSRSMQGRGKRIYCFRPQDCSCQRGILSGSPLIHLPVPYSLRPQPYLEHEDDTLMQETPSFHEIEDGSRCVGNMLLTPYGVRQAEKQQEKIKKDV
jgi:hypothetical protein